MSISRRGGNKPQTVGLPEGYTIDAKAAPRS
jgi:hypothetical protein